MAAERRRSLIHQHPEGPVDLHDPGATPRDWLATFVLVGFPVFSMIAAPIYVYFHGVHPMEIVTFLFFFLATAFSITMGYHRLFAHRTYDATPLLQWLLLVFGAFAWQYSAYSWVLDHRIHHQRTDSEIDPHSALKGFWHSHFKWLLYTRRSDRDHSLVSDLANNSLVMWQGTNYHFLTLLGLLIPAGIGYFYDRPFGFLLWGGFVRTAIVHQGTFLVNSWAHWSGRKPFDDGTTSRDSILVAFLAMGEGYHNFHHRFPGDYRNGVRWCHWDPTKWLIFSLSKIGLTSNLSRAPAELIASERQRAMESRVRA